MPRSYFADVVTELKKREHPAESKHIAASLGCTRETVLKHLRVLRGQGKIVRLPYWVSQFGYTWVYKWRNAGPLLIQEKEDTQ